MIIAEIGQAHDGSLGNAHAFIDALANTGVDAVKFQTHIAEAESSPLEPFRVKFSKQDETRFDYWKRMEFTPDQWKGLREHCKEVGLQFISSPFSIAAVNLLDSLDIDAFKVGSGEVKNFLLLEKMAKTGKPIILSSGMSSYHELKESIDFIKGFGNKYSVLQCTTAYPTSPEQWGLNVISELKERFDCTVGFSDHSGDIFACLAAASLGAEVFEFHVVFDKRQFGPDSPASIEIDQVGVLCKGIKDIQEALKNPIEKNDIQKYDSLKTMFGKSLSVNKDLVAGHILSVEDLESKKPGGVGIPADQFKQVLGKELSVSLNKWDFLKEEHIK
ncbi:N-acetylneuraminate synthase family protein [Algoriphagus zhangzhouensis]|uniref:N-acetylneuraminate synthase n=1 Tax=Algoriphagus zhangzhouensis TaxID=1073327 RepID=A0A1M7ZHY9_9BACT|nr:N-acetylneuraminate synthase family protein [Algoriphagus zhangzhouensis]TDY44280.1 N-acetylneuraminate synthase [Algoriphagus zhangzhouensis]SHO64494.1 N-acetylneuraminate synthase [Algoriphagus zhangzhouensis]